MEYYDMIDRIQYHDEEDGEENGNSRWGFYVYLTYSRDASSKLEMDPTFAKYQQYLAAMFEYGAPADCKDLIESGTRQIPVSLPGATINQARSHFRETYFDESKIRARNWVIIVIDSESRDSIAAGPPPLVETPGDGDEAAYATATIPETRVFVHAVDIEFDEDVGGEQLRFAGRNVESSVFWPGSLKIEARLTPAIWTMTEETRTEWHRLYSSRGEIWNGDPY